MKLTVEKALLLGQPDRIDAGLAADGVALLRIHCGGQTVLLRLEPSEAKETGCILVHLAMALASAPNPAPAGPPRNGRVQA